MTDRQIEELAAALVSRLDGNLGREGLAVSRQLILCLAEGRPVSPGRIGAALGLSPDEVVASLSRRPSLEWDEAGNVVGAGLTLRPTRHRFHLNRRTLYTWCALDALMYPALIGEAALVESECHATGSPVRLKVTPAGVESADPPGAVVSLVAPEASPDTRRAFCDYVHFFRSGEAAAGWLAQHPGAVTLPVAEAHRLGRRLIELRF